MLHSRKIAVFALAGSLLGSGIVLARAPYVSASDSRVNLADEPTESFLEKLEKSKKHMEGLHQMFSGEKTEHKEIRARTYKAIDDTLKALDEEIAAYKKDHPDAK